MDLKDLDFGQQLGLGGAGSVLDFGLGIASQAITNAMNWKYQQKQAQMEYDYQQRGADAAQQRQIDMWNMQNAYNDPSAQLSRLKRAGLSPALMGQGGGFNQAGGFASTATPAVNANFNGAQPGKVNAFETMIQTVQAFKSMGLLDEETIRMAQLAIGQRVDNMIKAVMGKEQYMLYRDKLKTFGYTDADVGDFDKYFGVTKEASSPGVSPSQTAEDVARADIKLGESEARLNDAKAVTESALLSGRISHLDALSESLRADASLQRKKISEVEVSVERLEAEARKLNMDAGILATRYDNEVAVAEASKFYGVDISDIPDSMRAALMWNYSEVLRGKMSIETAIEAATTIMTSYINRETHIPTSTSLSRTFLGVTESKSRSH